MSQRTASARRALYVDLTWPPHLPPRVSARTPVEAQAMTALNVLLISNRPSVHAFLNEHGGRSIPRIAAMNVPLALDALASHGRDVQDADVAMIDVGADPDCAVDVHRELARLRPDLRVLAVVCCPNPTMPWH